MRCGQRDGYLVARVMAAAVDAAADTPRRTLHRPTKEAACGLARLRSERVDGENRPRTFAPVPGQSSHDAP
jgi:hypothetical protein